MIMQPQNEKPIQFGLPEAKPKIFWLGTISLILSVLSSIGLTITAIVGGIIPGVPSLYIFCINVVVSILYVRQMRLLGVPVSMAVRTWFFVATVAFTAIGIHGNVNYSINYWEDRSDAAETRAWGAKEDARQVKNAEKLLGYIEGYDLYYDPRQPESYGELARAYDLNGKEVLFWDKRIDANHGTAYLTQIAYIDKSPIPETRCFQLSSKDDPVSCLNTNMLYEGRPIYKTQEEIVGYEQSTSVRNTYVYTDGKVRLSFVAEADVEARAVIARLKKIDNPTIRKELLKNTTMKAAKSPKQ